MTRKENAVVQMEAPKLTLFEMRQKREELFKEFFDGIIEQAAFTDEQAAAIREVLEAKSEDAIQKRDDIVDLLDAAAQEFEYLKHKRSQLDARIDQFASFVKGFRESIKMQMEILGVKRVEGRIHRMSLREGKDSVQILNLGEIPAEFLNWEPIPDKNEISKALHEGKEVPGASLVPAKSSLVIN
jgi:Siphovirus Gp157